MRSGGWPCSTCSRGGGGAHGAAGLGQTAGLAAWGVAGCTLTSAGPRSRGRGLTCFWKAVSALSSCPPFSYAARARGDCLCGACGGGATSASCYSPGWPVDRGPGRAARNGQRRPPSRQVQMHGAPPLPHTHISPAPDIKAAQVTVLGCRSGLRSRRPCAGPGGRGRARRGRQAGGSRLQGSGAAAGLQAAGLPAAHGADRAAAGPRRRPAAAPVAAPRAAACARRWSPHPSPCPPAAGSRPLPSPTVLRVPAR